MSPPARAGGAPARMLNTLPWVACHFRYPPGSMPAGVTFDEHGGFVTEQALGAWLLDHHPTVAAAPPEHRPLECICGPGDLM